MERPNCGKEISEEDSVCSYCGGLIREPVYDIEEDLEFENNT